MGPSDTPIKQRLHIRFGKFGALKYSGHLDMAKNWERILRRAKLPILYSQGFNPRPRIQLASALPLGITSECELLDVSLRERIDTENLVERLLAVSPDGLEIYAIEEAPVRGPALQTRVRSAEYRFHFEELIDRAKLAQHIDRILAAETITKIHQQRGKEIAIDIRPLIYDLYLDEPGDLIAHVAVGSHGNVRPGDLLREIELEAAHVNVHRFRLHLAPAPK